MEEGRTDEERAFKAVLAEYDMMRAEIGRCQDHQVAVLQFGFVVLGATAGLIGVIGDDEGSPETAVVLLIVPFIYALLAALYADRLRRLIDVATYIEHSLRGRAEALARYPVWEWEAFKCRYYDDLPKWPRRKVLLLDRLRWGIFVVPSAIAVLAFWMVAADEVEGGLAGLAAVLTAVDVLLLGAMLYLISDADETRGIRGAEAATGTPSDRPAAR